MSLVMVLDSRGRIGAAGPITAGFVVPEGGRLAPAPDTIHTDIAALDGPGVDLYWSGTAVFAKTRAATAAEADAADRLDMATKLQAALTNWDTLTAVQKDALLKACVRAALRAIR